MTSYIWTTFARAGIHQYSDVVNRPELKNQNYLQHRHRHLFKTRVAIEVFSDDRNLEFINFQEWLLSLYDTGVLELNEKSCEMISNDLAAEIGEEYPGRKMIIEVSEDGESGSYITYDAYDSDPDNYETVQLDIDEETHQRYLEIFVSDKLGVAAQRTFDAALEDGKSHHEALAAACFNEIAIDVLHQQINKTKTNNEPHPSTPY